jgi:hypothetical protein
MPETTEEIKLQREEQHQGKEAAKDILDSTVAVEGPDLRGFVLLVTGSGFLAYREMILS